MGDKDNSVKVAVRIRPLSDYEAVQDSTVCLSVIPGEAQIRAGGESLFSFDYVFGDDCTQDNIYDDCVSDLLEAAFEGFNATILAYGQTGSFLCRSFSFFHSRTYLLTRRCLLSVCFIVSGSGKTFTMGSAAEEVMSEESLGIIPRVIKRLFQMIEQREEENSRNTFKVYVQFLEIYGEDIKDLLDQTKTSKVAIRETRNGEIFVTGAKEELVNSFEQMVKALEDGTRNRTTASTKMNQTSSRSHGECSLTLLV
jgi:kinesin family member 21